MVKKRMFLALVVAVIFVISMVPVSASDLQDDIILDLGFEDGAVKDFTGNATSIDLTGEVSIMDDPDEGEVGSFDGMEQYYVVNGLPTENLSSLTIEMYVKLFDTEEKYCLINVSNFNVCIYSTTEATEFGSGHSQFPASATTGVTLKGGALPRGEWAHIVCTTDLTGSQKVYINGVLAGEQEKTVGAWYGNTPGIWVGSYYSPAGMDLSFVKLYDAVATADDVAALYSAATGNTVDPSADPSTSPSTSPSPSTDPSDNDNPKTFDLGIVSLAAVALSSVVAIKKRK